MGIFFVYFVLIVIVFFLGFVFFLLILSEGGFIYDCVYVGVNLIDKYYWIGVYCFNDDVDIYGFNYSM